jgi:hypothetical protein
MRRQNNFSWLCRVLWWSFEAKAEGRPNSRSAPDQEDEPS